MWNTKEFKQKLDTAQKEWIKPHAKGKCSGLWRIIRSKWGHLEYSFSQGSRGRTEGPNAILMATQVSVFKDLNASAHMNTRSLTLLMKFKLFSLTSKVKSGTIFFFFNIFVFNFD